MTTQDQNDDRRRAMRVEKIQLVQVSRFNEEGFHSDLATGRTLNLSGGGVRLELGQSLPLRSVVNVSIALGDEIVEVTGKVIYLEVIDDERVAMGISFSEVSADARKVINHHLDDADRAANDDA